MARKFYVWNKELDQFVEVKREARKESDSANIITDECDPFVSHVDGETVFTSKQKYAEHVKEAGYEQMGRPPEPWKLENKFKTDPREVRDAVEKAYYDLKYDKVPINEEQRERWKQEERNIRKNTGK